MELLHYHGPFYAGDSSTIMLPGGYDFYYSHIGIQTTPRGRMPFSQQNQSESQLSDIRLYIDGDNRNFDFKLSDSGMLEFDNLHLNSFHITFLRDFPLETTIEIAKRTIENG